MPSRRVKFIMHGSAESTRVYHHDHVSKRKRRARYLIEQEKRHRAAQEKYIGYKMDQQADAIVREFNNNKRYRKKYDKGLPR